MSIIAWIFCGLGSGFISSKLARGGGQLLLMEMILGVLGALVGGMMYHLFGQAAVTDVNLKSVFMSVLGAAAILVAYRGFSGRPARA